MAETQDRWLLVCETDREGSTSWTEVLPIKNANGKPHGCLVRSITRTNPVHADSFLSEAITFVPDVGPEHFGII